VEWRMRELDQGRVRKGAEAKEERECNYANAARKTMNGPISALVEVRRESYLRESRGESETSSVSGL